LEKHHAPNRFVPLDPTSEIVLAWESDRFTQTEWTAFSWKGLCDIPALQAALQQTMGLRPFFRAHLIAGRHGLLKTYAWQLTDEPYALEIRDLRDMDKCPDDIDLWLQGALRPVINKTIGDLSTEHPVRFILLLLPENTEVFTVVWHHVATDGGGLYDFLRDLFSKYHRLVKGNDPDWAHVAGFHAQAGKIEEVRPMPWGSFLKETITQVLHYPLYRPAQMISSPDPHPVRNMIRHVFDDPVLPKALRERARRDGGTVSDLCLAAAKLALQEWNEDRGQPPQVMYHGLAVNQRLRQAQTQTNLQNNPFSAIGIPSLPANRKDPQTILRHVIGYRRKMLDIGYDINLQRLMFGVIRAGHLLPIGVRYPALRMILVSKMSFFVSNAGIPWPRIENGRPTGETAIKQIGDMELLDVHNSVGTTFNNPMSLIIGTFLGRFRLGFAVNTYRISDKDAQNFSKLVVDKIMRYL